MDCVYCTGVGKWFGLGGDNNDSCKNKYFSLYFTLDLVSKLSVKPKNLGGDRPPSPPASYAYVLGLKIANLKSLPNGSSQAVTKLDPPPPKDKVVY